MQKSSSNLENYILCWGAKKDRIVQVARSWSKEMGISDHFLYYCHSVSSAANAFSILLFSFVVECVAEWEGFLTKRRNWNNVYFLRSPYYFAGSFLRLCDLFKTNPEQKNRSLGIFGSKKSQGNRAGMDFKQSIPCSSLRMCIPI